MRQGRQYCQNCMPDEYHWLVPVDSKPDPFFMDRHHAYITPNNKIYVLSHNRKKALELGGAGGDLAEYALKSELVKYLAGAGIVIDNNTIRTSVDLVRLVSSVADNTATIEEVKTKTEEALNRPDKDTTYTAGENISISRDNVISLNVNFQEVLDRLVANDKLDEQQRKDIESLRALIQGLSYSQGNNVVIDEDKKIHSFGVTADASHRLQNEVVLTLKNPDGTEKNVKFLSMPGVMIADTEPNGNISVTIMDQKEEVYNLLLPDITALKEAVANLSGNQSNVSVVGTGGVTVSRSGNTFTVSAPAQRTTNVVSGGHVKVNKTTSGNTDTFTITGQDIREGTQIRVAKDTANNTVTISSRLSPGLGITMTNNVIANKAVATTVKMTPRTTNNLTFQSGADAFITFSDIQRTNNGATSLTGSTTMIYAELLAHYNNGLRKVVVPLSGVHNDKLVRGHATFNITGMTGTTFAFDHRTSFTLEVINDRGVWSLLPTADYTKESYISSPNVVIQEIPKRGVIM